MRINILFDYPPPPSPFQGYGKTPYAAQHKLALMCAQSWYQNGWETAFFKAPIIRQYKRFPAAYGQIGLNAWHAIAALAPGWFCHINVFNARFRTAMASTACRMIPCDKYALTAGMKPNFVASCFWCDVFFAREVIRLIDSYENGDFDMPGIHEPGEESIITNRLPFGHLEMMSFGLSTERWEQFPLVYFQEGCLQFWPNPKIDQFPAVVAR